MAGYGGSGGGDFRTVESFTARAHWLQSRNTCLITPRRGRAAVLGGNRNRF